MWWSVAADFGVAAALIGLWYLVFAHLNRRRARHLVSALETAFASHGYLCGLEWLSASEFRVRLRLSQCVFSHSFIVVKMLAREMPLEWLYQRLRRKPETMTFEANLLCPPGFDLDVQNQRWPVRKLKKARMKPLPTGSTVLHKALGPFVLCSRRDWQREITTMMHSLASARDCEFLKVSFHRSAPHFSATVVLDTIANESCSPVRVFEALRELASGASTARP